VLHVRVHLWLVLSLALCLPWLEWLPVAVLAGGIAVWHLAQGLGAMKTLLRGMWRLKWLLLAIVLVYFWLPSQSDARPVWWDAGERALILLTVFAAVHTLLYSHRPMTVGAALSEGLGKLDALGLPGKDFSRRLALLMEMAMGERQRLQGIDARGQAWFRGLPRLLADQIRQLEMEAASMEGDSEGFPRLGPSPRWQWFLLLGFWLMLGSMFLY